MTKDRTITVRLSEAEYEAIDKKATELGMSISSLVRMLARAEIEITIKAMEYINNE